MDASNFKSHKLKANVLQPSINIPGAEVYAVVPPDLLQKFGLDSLITVGKNDFFPEEHLNNAELLLSNNSEETISETASLLKESILITGSPNLTSTPSKITRETETSNGAIDAENKSKITAKGILYLDTSDRNEKEPWAFDNTSVILEKTLSDSETSIPSSTSGGQADIVKSFEKLPHINNIESCDQKGSPTLSVHKSEDERDENKNYYETTDEKKRLLKDKIRNMVVNKHANIREEREKRSEDKDSPIKNSKHCINSSSNILQIKSKESIGTKPASKINIISEEIVDPSKILRLKGLHSSNVVLTPVTIKSVIKPKKTEDCVDSVQTDSSSVIKTYSKTHRLPRPLFLNGESSKEFNSNEVSQSFISKSKIADNIPTSTCAEQISGDCVKLSDTQTNQSEAKHTLICNEDKDTNAIKIVEHNNNREMDPLPTNIDERSNAEHINNFDNNCKDHAIADNETVPNLNENINTAKSKLCVQGVEKPGGEETNMESETIPTAIKTYRKSERLKQSVSRNVNTKSTNEVEYPTHEVGTTEINAVVSYEECKYEEFCICEDFGKLFFYDSDLEYEHIHFWKGESTTVDPKLIFSLYDDECYYPRVDVDFSFSNVHTEESSADVCVNYCWNRYLCNENVTKKNEVSDCESFNGQKNISSVKDLTKKRLRLDSLETKTNEEMKSNLKIDHVVDQQALYCSIREGNVNMQPRVMLTKCVESPERISSDQMNSISDDKNNIENKEPEEKCGITNNSDGDLNQSIKSLVDQTPEEGIIESTSLDTSSISKFTDISQNIPVTENSILVDNTPNVIITENVETTSKENPSTSKYETITELIEKPKPRRGRPPKSIKNTLKVCISESPKEPKSTTAINNVAAVCVLDDDSNDVTIIEQINEVSKTSNDLDATSISVDDIQNANKLENIQTINNESAITSPSAKLTKLEEKPKARRGRPPKNKSLLSISASDPTGSKNNSPVLDISIDGRGQASTSQEVTNNSAANLKSIMNESANAITLAEAIKSIETPKRKRGRPRKNPVLTPEPTDKSRSTKVNTSNDSENRLIKHFYKEQSSTSTTQEGNDEIGPHNDEASEETVVSRKRSSHITIQMSEDENNDSEIPSKVRRRSTRNMSMQSNSARDTDNEENHDNADRHTVQCGVCKEHIKSEEWLSHIAKEHDYLAWQEGNTPLDLDDEIEVKSHLQDILKDVDALVCNICGLQRKYVAAYLKHKRICEPYNVDESVITNNSQEESFNNSAMDMTLNENQSMVQCAVCKMEVRGSDWIHHIGKQHFYLAWVEGETPVDVNDAVEVQKYLMSIGKKAGGLVCYKCGFVRKYAKFYLQHIEVCHAENKFAVDTGSLFHQNTGEKVQCAVCFEDVSLKDWKRHAMNKHYNVAWVVGDMALDLKNFYAVEKYLKEYKLKRNNKLVCRVCSDSKVSCCGFYAHVLTCGKSEEEIEEYKDVCEICNKKYLCIYKSQHMTMHREQMYAKERKLKLSEYKVLAVQKEEVLTETSSRRKAAERANSVIAKYKEELNDIKYSDSASGYSSDSDVSVKLEQYSEDDSDHTDGMSDISEEEDEDMDKKMKRPTESNAPVITRIPFPVESVKSYMDECYEDFCENNLTSERLFPDWNSFVYEEVCEENIDNYMPVLKESCKVNIQHDGWKTYSLFESELKDGVVRLFAGASVQCVCWVPGGAGGAAGAWLGAHYLAVACHSATDCPRYNCDEAVEHPNLLQIWDFGDIDTGKPRFVFGLAHDYGTVWAMDWCPSGARDLLTDEPAPFQAYLRMGLLAIACSNGSAYIFYMPYPSMVTVKDKLFYKVTPVAELRLSSAAEGDRKYQATSLKWSLQKGHNTIMVGYSNGCVAYFDLTNDSPLLVSKENGVKIIYPFSDERSHNSCVTGVDMFAGGGAACSGSASGARAWCGAGGRGAALLSSLACAGVFFLPHWPSAVLTAVNSKVNQTVNELEWQGACGRSGRRVGGVRVRAACARCGALAAAADPLLRVLRTHPVQHDAAKYVAAIIQMTTLAQKRKQTNDELAMKLEPLTYDDAVKKYGIQLNLLSKKNKVEQQKAQSMPLPHYPERFPLSEITSMAFCPANNHHNKLAVATHSGVIFLLTIT